MTRLLLPLVLLCLAALPVMAQRDSIPISDSSNTQLAHSPKKAAIYSAVLPGAGQAYNKKYWKIPIVYAGLATSIYFVDFNRGQYRTYNQAYVLRVDGDSTTTHNFPFYSENNLLELSNFYQRNLEVSYIATGVVYLLNILDATVDGHLFDFDIDDDLSLHLAPSVTSVQSIAYTGFTATFKLNP